MDKIILLPGQGKTTRLIKKCAKEGGYIVCLSLDECSRIASIAKDLELNINFPISFGEFISGQYYAKGIKKFHPSNIECNIIAEKIMSYNGRILIKNKDKLSEINFIEIPNNLQAVPRHLCNVMEYSTQLYDGVIIQNILGMFVASISPQKNTCYNILDLFAKNFFGVFLTYIILTKSY